MILDAGCWMLDTGCSIIDTRYLIPDTRYPMARIKVDLHAIYNNSKAIDKALLQAFEDAIDKRIKEVEIIPGKGSGQLRKKVERFLQLPHIKPLYHRIENDSKNFGRLFVYFKF